MLRELQSCLDACLQCIQDCERLLAEAVPVAELGDWARLCRDCADICQLCAYLLLRKSTIHARSYAICADICLRCAEACEASEAADSSGDGLFHELLQNCADSSRVCAELCLRMGSSAAA